MKNYLRELLRSCFFHVISVKKTGCIAYTSGQCISHMNIYCCCMSLCNYFQLPLGWKWQNVKYHALALNSIRLFCNTGLPGFFSDQIGHAASSPGEPNLCTPAAFFRTRLGQFSMFVSSTAHPLMLTHRRIPPSTRNAVCAQPGTSRTQNMFCTSQQYMPIPHTSL